MAEEGERQGNASRGNEWEVVSLTASTYAAAPGPHEVEVKGDHKDSSYDDAETSRALFMSSHFVFPPNEHENLPLESIVSGTNKDEVHNDGDPECNAQEESLCNQKDDEDLTLKELNLPYEFTQTQFSGEKCSKEQRFYESSSYGSFHVAKVDESTACDEPPDISEPTESGEGGLDFTADASHVTRTAKDNQRAACDHPCEAWWRRRATSLYNHAKEANAFWSVFIAATVMGLVILGQHWQRERWQVLQLKWLSSISNEKTSRMLGSISRLKDVIVGGNRRASFIMGRSSSES